MTLYALLFTLSAIGISETFYLIKTRKKKIKPVCVVGADSCQIVLESKYNNILGLHYDMLGFLFYLFLSLLLGFIVTEFGASEIWKFAARTVIYIAAVFSVFLTYLQKFIIKAWCFWCLMSAVTIWIMALIIFLTDLI